MLPSIMLTEDYDSEKIFKLLKLIGTLNYNNVIGECVLFDKQSVDNYCKYLLGEEYDEDMLIQHKLTNG